MFEVTCNLSVRMRGVLGGCGSESKGAVADGFARTLQKMPTAISRKIICGTVSMCSERAKRRRHVVVCKADHTNSDWLPARRA